MAKKTAELSPKKQGRSTRYHKPSFKIQSSIGCNKSFGQSPTAFH